MPSAHADELKVPPKQGADASTASEAAAEQPTSKIAACQEAHKAASLAVSVAPSDRLGGLQASVRMLSVAPSAIWCRPMHARTYASDPAKGCSSEVTHGNM